MDNVVIDTNVLLVSVSRKSPFHWIIRKLINEEYTLYVTTDILLEYEEIIEQKMGTRASEAAMGVLENLNNVVELTTYYRFSLLADEDDNKFVDCAIAANADYLVSEHSDFNLLKQVRFPKVEVIGVESFYAKLHPDEKR